MMHKGQEEFQETVDSCMKCVNLRTFVTQGTVHSYVISLVNTPYPNGCSYM